MELEQLEQLDAVERCGTMSAAARELHISQPALSRSIQRLEAELGCELFDRGKNRVELNDVGRVAVEHARSVLREERRLRDAVRDAARQSRPLRAATCAPAPLWRLTRIAVEAFPGTMLETSTVSEQDVEEGVLNGAIDLGILAHPVMLPTLSCMRFMTENLFACIPEEDPLAKRPYVGYADLDGHDFLLMGNIGFWMDQMGRMPRTHFIIQQDREVFMQLARTSRLFYFVTDAGEGAHEAPGHAVVPISDAAAHATFYLLTRADASPQVKGIVQAVVAASERDDG